LLVLVAWIIRPKTHAHLLEKKRFGINVLASDQRDFEFYAGATETHQHAEAAGRDLTGLRMGRRFCAVL